MRAEDREVGMRIGIVKELTPGESRVALTPHAVYELSRAGHRVLVELGAGEMAAISDEEYSEAGARVVGEASEVYGEAELMAKVYGPLQEEYDYLRPGLMIFAFLSLPTNRGLTRALLDSGCVGFAMESIRGERGGLPLLTPMSEIAGRLVPQIGAHYLQSPFGGRGVLLGGATGVRPGRVVVLGAGIVGSGAARVASGLGAEVVVLDRDIDRLRRFEAELPGGQGITTLAASGPSIRDAVLRADLVIGAILIVGSRTPHLVDQDTVREMKSGGVIVDVDVDQGGCFETSRPTTLSEPTFVEHGVTHYCVKNVPAAVPVTSTRALSNALLPYVKSLAGVGLVDALNKDYALRRGVAVAEGRIVSPTLGQEYGVEYEPITSLLPLHPEVR